jgi:hypothetical protein
VKYSENPFLVKEPDFIETLFKENESNFQPLCFSNDQEGKILFFENASISFSTRIKVAYTLQRAFCSLKIKNTRRIKFVDLNRIDEILIDAAVECIQILIF